MDLSRECFIVHSSWFAAARLCAYGYSRSCRALGALPCHCSSRRTRRSIGRDATGPCAADAGGVAARASAKSSRTCREAPNEFRRCPTGEVQFLIASGMGCCRETRRHHASPRRHFSLMTAIELLHASRSQSLNEWVRLAFMLRAGLCTASLAIHRPRVARDRRQESHERGAHG
jgi:hypothetical protein